MKASMKRMSLLLACLVFVVGSSVYANGEPTYEMDCQPPTRYARVLHLQDVSPNMVNFVESGLLGVGGGIEQFDQWLHHTFDDGAVSGIMNFDDKRFLGGSVCANTWQDLSVNPILPQYTALTLGSGNPSSKRSVLDVIYRATQYDWDVPQDAGRKIVVIYAGGLPEFPPVAGLNAFDDSLQCESIEYPSVDRVQTALVDANVHPIFVVPDSLVDEYKSIFGTNVVVPLSTDGTAQFENMFNAFNLMYCGVPVPTQEPQGTTPDVILTDPTDQPPICTENAFLQLLHIQDISSSYNLNLPEMISKFPQLMTMLDAKFFEKQMGLASFSDKPVGGSGYSYDYCYREDLLFTSNNQDFMDATQLLEIQSGRDWKESQYDALYFGANSPSLGWETQQFVNGENIVLRVAIVATDSGPHVLGDLASLLPPNGPTCSERDYPSPAELGASLEAAGVHPIFIVTSDIYNYWVNVWSPKIATEVTILELSSDVDALFDAILDALTKICEGDRRRLVS